MKKNIRTVIILLFGIIVMSFASYHYYCNLYSGEEVKINLLKGQEYELPKAHSPIYKLTLRENNIIAYKKGIISGNSEGTVVFSLYNGLDKITYHINVYEIEEPDTSDRTQVCGDEFTLDRQDEELPVEWRISDQSLVKVTKDGNVTCLKPGDVTISEIINHSKTYNYQIHIDEPKLNFEEKKIKKDEEIRLVLSPCNGTIEWESSDPSVADIDDTGKITGKKEGTATMTAKIGEVTQSCKITVK